MILLRYIFKRLLLLIPTLLGVVTIVFLMVRIIPGDPAEVIGGVMASQEDVERIRIQLGLDKPIHVQYAVFITQLLTFDLGTSARTGAPVISEIAFRLPNTVLLAIVSLAIGSSIGLLLGVLAATKRGTILDRLASTAAVLGFSMPVYWLGLMLIIVFAVQLRLLPAGGSGSPSHLVLPALTLSLVLMGNIARMTRGSMIDVLDQSYIRVTRAKGLAEVIVVYGHALRNALIPVITIMGLQFGQLLGGAVLTETVFAWPGMGKLTVDSILARDYSMVQGCIFIFALMFAMVNLLVDILYACVNPRIRYE